MAGSFSQCTKARAAITASTPPPSARATLPCTAFLADVGDLAAGGRRAGGRVTVVAAVVVPVVTAVVVRVLLDLGAVQHHPEEPSARLLHALERRALPTSTSDRPGDLRARRSVWLCGRRRSQSMRSTFPPSEARMSARLTEVTVLPSPAEVEVTRRMREVDSGQE